MKLIKEPKTEHDSVTLRHCDRSRWVMLGFAALIIASCVGYEFLPERYQAGIIAGLGTAGTLLIKLGFDFTGVVKTRRRMIGDTESPLQDFGSDPGQGFYIVRMSEAEYKAAAAAAERRQNKHYVPEV